MKKCTVLSVVILMALSVSAQQITVPGDQPSVQAAINAASEGDTVIVEEGTYYENINFKGKAITVASRFILDRDSSHISLTILDGSKSTNPDTASVVLMISGEDTTSVLMGFTITGGSGTYVDDILAEWISPTYYGGGGVFINNSGGLICDNIIEGNHILCELIEDEPGGLGGGLLAAVSNKHTAIVRNNVVRDNSVEAYNIGGGGMVLCGGRLIVENNLVSQNEIITNFVAVGAGIFFQHEDKAEVIREVHIRSNTIQNNKITSTWVAVGGGLALDWADAYPLVYNNLICENEAYRGVGIYANQTTAKVFNNTVVNNNSPINVTSVQIGNNTHMVMFNNIIWSDPDKLVETVGFDYSENASLELHNCIIKSPVKDDLPVMEKNVIYMDPAFGEGTYKPSAGSPAVGRGLVSLEIDEQWYSAPLVDLEGSSRYDTDEYVDIGAFESGHPFPNNEEAYLVDISFRDKVLNPEFNMNTLSYTIEILDTVSTAEELRAIPAYPNAGVDINLPNLESADEADWYASIKVTSFDGANQKDYEVFFNQTSTNAFLSSLEVVGVHEDSMQPAFDPEIMEYEVNLSSTFDSVPEVLYTLADDNATVKVYPATDIMDDAKNRTIIIVTSEAGNDFRQTYRITFHGSVGVSPGSGLAQAIKLYPNPFSTETLLQIPDGMKVSSVDLVNVTGKRIRSLDCMGQKEILVERRNLPPGLYFLHIRAEKQYVLKCIVR